MNKKFCDLCQKEIIDNKDVNIHIQDPSSIHNLLLGHSFCEKCGKPILTFLKKHKLLKKERA
jgi:hypothetical protein